MNRHYFWEENDFLETKLFSGEKRKFIGENAILGKNTIFREKPLCV